MEFAQNAGAWNGCRGMLRGGFAGVEGEEQTIGGSAAHNADLADAAFDGALGGFQLQNHAAGNDAGLHEALDFLAGDGGKNMFAVKNAGDVGEVNQLIGGEIFGASRGHVVGVDVVELVVGADAQAGSDGEQALAPERFEKWSVEAGEVADETETARDFVVKHGFGFESAGIGGGNAHGGLARGSDRGG